MKIKTLLLYIFTLVSIAQAMQCFALVEDSPDCKNLGDICNCRYDSLIGDCVYRARVGSLACRCAYD